MVDCGGETDTGSGEAKTRKTRTREETQRTGEKVSQGESQQQEEKQT